MQERGAGQRVAVHEGESEELGQIPCAPSLGRGVSPCSSQSFSASRRH
jgi:hypothetical protein